MSLETSLEVSTVNFINPIPHHVAIIMDGNRRWAYEKDMPSAFGHWKGAEALTQIVKAASDMGIKVLTVYAFSTENWARQREEVDYLMQLFETYLLQQKEAMIEQGVKLDAIGDLSRLPQKLQKVFLDVKQATCLGKNIELVLALSYGGRDEILRGVKAVIKDVENGKLIKDLLTEDMFSNYLDTAKWPDPDLLIRTSGENRLSNFLLWQLCYTEVVVTDVLWPDFLNKNLKEAVDEYRYRKRRKGSL
jgi:undecaprenyl diphosphate synthase